MNPLDWILIALLSYSIVRAFMRGLVQEAFALAGLIIGMMVASWGYERAAVKLHGLIATTAIAQFVAFLGLLAVTMVIFFIAGKLLRKTASSIGLGLLDRMGGAVFGFVRGCLLGVALLMAFTAFLPTVPWIRDSKMAPYFLEAGHAVSFVVPEDFKRKLRNGAASIKHTTPDWIKPGP